MCSKLNDRSPEWFKQLILKTMSKRRYRSIYSALGLTAVCFPSIGGIRSIEDQHQFDGAVRELLAEGRLIKSTQGIDTYFSLPD